jgi:hypothetical protein
MRRHLVNHSANNELLFRVSVNYEPKCTSGHEADGFKDEIEESLTVLSNT